MACVSILNGINDSCFQGFVGGINEVYILDKTYFSGYTLNATTEVISGLTLATGQTFKTYKLNSKVASTFTVNGTPSVENGTNFYTSEIAVKFYKMNAVTRLELKNLTIGNLIMIVLDGNSKYWLVGLEGGLTVSAIAGTTGGSRGDYSGYDITFQEISRYMPFEIQMVNIRTYLDSYSMIPLNL